MKNNIIRQNYYKLLQRKPDIIKILLSIVFIVHIFLPLTTMLVRIDKASVYSVFNSSNFTNALVNSITASLIATFISVVLAYFLALCIERVQIRFKNLFVTLFTIPMLIPSISHGMGLVFLLGNNGIITNLLNLNFDIYGLWGIVAGSVLYSYPVAFLMFYDVMKYENGTPYEAAEVLGIPKLHRFMKISLPYLKKPLISIIFSTFTLIITDYGVPLMIGGKYTTIPVIMYQEVIGQLNFSKGAVYGLILIVPAIIAFIIDLFAKDKDGRSFINKPIAKSTNKAAKISSYTFCVIITLLTLLPVVSFAVTAFTKSYPYDLTLSLQNLEKATNMRVWQYMLNSIIVAFAVGLIGTFISFWTAYMSARMKTPVSRFLHLSVITTAAIPGIVLGLAYVLTFRTTFIYGTFAILILVNTVHFVSSPYLMMYNYLSKANENLENVGHTLGISRFHMIRSVFIPMCKSTLIEMFSYFFVNSMMTISAVSFLATAMNKPLSLMISQFDSQMQIGAAAVVSLLILAINLFVKFVLSLIKKYCFNN